MAGARRGEAYEGSDSRVFFAPGQTAFVPDYECDFDQHHDDKQDNGRHSPGVQHLQEQGRPAKPDNGQDDLDAVLKLLGHPRVSRRGSLHGGKADHQELSRHRRSRGTRRPAGGGTWTLRLFAAPLRNRLGPQATSRQRHRRLSSGSLRPACWPRTRPTPIPTNAICAATNEGETSHPASTGGPHPRTATRVLVGRSPNLVNARVLTPWYPAICTASNANSCARRVNTTVSDISKGVWLSWRDVRRPEGFRCRRSGSDGRVAVLGARW